MTAPFATGSVTTGVAGDWFVDGAVAVATSMKSILLFEAPEALVSVSLPSETVTDFVASTQRDALVGVPLSAS